METTAQSYKRRFEETQAKIEELNDKIIELATENEKQKALKQEYEEQYNKLSNNLKWRYNMNIPDKIKIGGVIYNIEQDTSIADGNITCYGQINYNETVIKLNPNFAVSKQMQCITLWHEIIHGICEHANLELGNTKEQIVDTIAKGIYQVIQDNNKKLFGNEE